MNPAKLFLAAFLVNNILLLRFIALCSFFGVSTSLSTSVGMSAAVIFVMLLAAWVSWGLYYVLLLPLNLVFLRTAVFILVIAGLVQFVEMFLKKYVRTLYSAMGIYLPLITTNCAILAVTFINVDNHTANSGYGLLHASIYALGVGAGYALAIILFAAIRERLEDSPITASFKGYPIAFVGASLMSLAFLGFAGLFGISL